MNLEADNLTQRVNQAGEVVVEPNYVEFLRNEGHVIESISETHTVPSESDKDKAYLVMMVDTYQYPRDHPELDIAEHGLSLPVCSCWSYRSSSADVSEGNKPDGDCKHVRAVFREQRAQADEQQEKLV
jgi:hypothetical protein